MPYNAEDPRFSKKRKAKDCVFPSDGHGSGFAFRDASKELPLKQQHARYNCSVKTVRKLNLQEAVEESGKQNVKGLPSLKPFTAASLKIHMESVLSEVNEARENLFQWWKEEIQAILSVACERRMADAGTKQTNKQGDCATTRDHISANGGRSSERGNLDPEILGPGKPFTVLNACKDRAYKTCSDDMKKKACEFLSVDHNPVVVDVVHESSTSKHLNEPEQGNASNEAERKTNTLSHNVMAKPPSEIKSPLFESCGGADLGVDTKDVDGLDGALESGVTMRDGFESSKVNHEIQRNLDGLERLRETKSSLFDMSFDGEESNEGNGVGCSLESAASSKVNLSSCKKNMGMSTGLHKGGIETCLDEQGAEHLGLNGGPEGSASVAEIFMSMKVKTEIISEEKKHADVKDEPVNYVVEGRLDDESRQVDAVIRSKSGQLKESLIGAGSLAQVNQSKDALQHVSMGTRSGSGTHSSHLAGMTFKGSVLECTPDVFQNASAGFVNTLNSVNSSNLSVKDSVQIPGSGDKGRGESLALPSAAASFRLTGSTMPSENMLTTSKNSINQTLQDCKDGHFEYASRSRLGDAILGCGRAVDFPGFDPLIGYNPQFKAAFEMADVFQQERAAANSMYFSSLCTNNSSYLQSSNRVVGVQRSTTSTPPSSAALSWPMLMAAPSHSGGYHHRGHRDPSNMHSFLGLGMNGVQAAANGMQAYSGLYLQDNQQHNQGPFKNTSQSSSLVLSHNENSTAQEKAIIELNF